MSITSDISTARTASPEAQACGDLYAKVRADMLRRICESHDKLEREAAQLKRERFPKSTHWPHTPPVVACTLATTAPEAERPSSGAEPCAVIRWTTAVPGLGPLQRTVRLGGRRGNL